MTVVKQKQLNGPQTTGREYRNLSAPEHGMRHHVNVATPMRDGISLMADVHRPDADGRFPALIAASPYPRQIQDLGAPMGFIEAGDTDFWVSRGYVHVIANLRGTGGSGGPSASLTVKSAKTCTISSNGRRSNPGRMATSAWWASAISP